MNMRTKQLVLKELIEVVELFPNIPIAQHWNTILRPYTGSYEWSDEILLRSVERYRIELENDQDDEYDEEIGYYNQNIK